MTEQALCPWVVIDTADPPTPPTPCWTEAAARQLASRLSSAWWVGRFKVVRRD